VKYLEIPYVEDGRGWNGCDCFGLFILWYKHELGIDVFDAQFSRKLDVPVVHLEKLFTEFSRTEHPTKHDLVLLKYDCDLHVGVCVDDKQFIHTFERVGCSVSEIRTWESNIIGFYRHKKVKG
jgi:cell wall-associated NlpC family hydrolase